MPFILQWYVELAKLKFNSHVISCIMCSDYNLNTTIFKWINIITAVVIIRWQYNFEQERKLRNPSSPISTFYRLENLSLQVLKTNERPNELGRDSRCPQSLFRVFANTWCYLWSMAYHLYLKTKPGFTRMSIPLQEMQAKKIFEHRFRQDIHFYDR